MARWMTVIPAKTLFCPALWGRCVTQHERVSRCGLTFFFLFRLLFNQASEISWITRAQRRIAFLRELTSKLKKEDLPHAFAAKTLNINLRRREPGRLDVFPAAWLRDCRAGVMCLRAWINPGYCRTCEAEGHGSITVRGGAASAGAQDRQRLWPHPAMACGAELPYSWLALAAISS